MTPTRARALLEHLKKYVYDDAAAIVEDLERELQRLEKIELAARRAAMDLNAKLGGYG